MAFGQDEEVAFGYREPVIHGKQAAMFAYHAGFDIRVAEWAIFGGHDLSRNFLRCRASEAGGIPSKVIELGREVYKVYPDWMRDLSSRTCGIR
jgi:hypothetical protein